MLSSTLYMYILYTYIRYVMNVTNLHRAEPLSNGIYLVFYSCQGNYYTELLFRVSTLHYLEQL